MQPFIWGAATSAQQVEGQLHHNDWAEWAQSRSDRAAIRQASGHWEQWLSDVQLAQQLGHNAHRLSLEWSRLEPAEGDVSSAAWSQYRQRLSAVRDLGMASFVTLHHFTNPLWFQRAGGWAHQGAVSAFTRYMTEVVKQVGDLVDVWLTFHDPVLLTLMATSDHVGWPVGPRGWRIGPRMIRHLAAAHRAAYRTIHQHYPTAPVGVSMNYGHRSPLLQQWQRATGATHDFLGLHLGENETVTTTLQHVSQRGVPIFITEDGFATDNDALRANYLRQRLREIEQAQATGVPIHGYIYRSLLDGFEWTEGFKSRYGLIAVDFNTLKRTPRPSAYVYQAIINLAQPVTHRA